MEEHYEYDNYGEIVSGDVGKTRYLYTGREHDASTGLQYNRARWYDPAVGRWLNQDPIGFAAGDTNIYRYVGNKSTLSVDPSGLEEPGYLSIPYEFAAGALQGLANIGNGLQDSAIGVANLALWIPNLTADLVYGSHAGDLRIPYIPSPDWSRDLVRPESDLAHSISKMAGAAGVEMISGTVLARLRHVTILK